MVEALNEDRDQKRDDKGGDDAVGVEEGRGCR